MHVQPMKRSRYGLTDRKMTGTVRW